MSLLMRYFVVAFALTFIAYQPAFGANRLKACRDEYHAQNIPKSQYRQFMKDCLKRNAPDVADNAEKTIVNKSRNAACRAQATALKLHGEARKIFVGTCLENF